MTVSAGERLRNARLDKKISLEKAAQALHIRIKYLEALEENKRDLLPSQVQGKGFLRLYAGYLGLSVQQMLDLWDGRIPVPDPVVEIPTPNQNNIKAHLDQGIPSKLPAAEPVVIPPEVDPASKNRSLLSFQEIGQELFTRRMALNLSLNDVERFTHVRQHYLKALEEGRLDDLPSTVQARGMLNNYARFLDLDAEELLNNFAEGLQSRREERLGSQQNEPSRKKYSDIFRKSEQKRAASPNRWLRILTPDLVIVGSVIIGLLLFAVWSAAQVSSRQQDTGKTTPLSIADVLLSSTAQPQLSTLTPTLAPNLGTRQPQTPVNTQIGGSTLAPTGAVPIMGSGALQIYIVATQRTYLRVTADNRIIFDERLIPGNAYAFAGNRSIEVLIGNAAGVQVFFNQRDLGTLGLTGEVKRLLFTSEGVITPTLAFSPTPTRTPVPSSTPRPSPTIPTATITPFIP